MRSVLVLFVVACSSHPVEHRMPAMAPEPVEVEPLAPPPARSAPGPSIYELEMSVTRAAGDAVGLDVDRGHPTLISMFYGSCAAACPLLIQTIGRTLDQLPERERAGVRVLLISFDPARDTPARLRELVRVHHLDERWTLAAAGADDARTLAAVLGIRYRAVEGGQFFHTSAIVALDREGHTLARMDGIGDPSALVAAIGD